MNRQLSRLQKLRAEYHPPLPRILQNLHHVGFKFGSKTTCISDEQEVSSLFPHTFGAPTVEGIEKGPRDAQPLRVGVVLSGGQAPGGHNVIIGLHDALESLNKESRLLGFLGGPSGIVEGKFEELTSEKLELYRNQGGFDLIGSGRTKIETEEQFAGALKTATDLNLDGIVIIGGDDSNTNAAALAEYFLEKKCKTTVVGVPKTIDGDLRNAHAVLSFGFDTATKIYAEAIGNIARDALSAKKYTHFIKLMGRSASHITLECALLTHPNVALIGEEIAEKKKTLPQVVSEIADVISLRSEKGMDYGIVLIPEGIVEFIPGIVDSLPPQELDPHGNIQLSQIESEKLIISAVEQELKKRNFKGKFAPQAHFFGYEGRAGFPTNFDAQYTLALGKVAALLIDEKLTGMMACIGDLHKRAEQWQIAGIPITMLLNMEERKGERRPVIQKALVNLKGSAFTFFDENRRIWAEEDHYRYPGPIQFFGDRELTDSIPLSLQLDNN